MKLDNFSAISLFSGALGLDIGLEQAGFQAEVIVECNQSAIETARTNKNFLKSNSPFFLQKKMTPQNIEDICDEMLAANANLSEHGVSLLAGAPPCQPFSTAGKRLSIQDERASGFDLMFAAIKKLTPRFFVIENVPGVLSAAQKHRPLAERGPGFPQLRSNEQYGSAFQEILKELGTLCCEKGYCATWGILNSADYGVPQKRLRLVIIGSLDGFSLWPEQTHSNLPSGSLLNWVSLKEAIGDLKETTPLFKGFNEQTKEFLELIPQGGNWRNLPECSKEQAMGKAFKSWGGRSGFLRRLSWNEPSPTITSSPMGRATLMCHPVENRPLTVRECARIQGFPDSWNFSGSVTEQYQQIGNATPVGLGLAIGRALRIDNLNLEQNLYAGEVFCAQPELISKLGKRPRTKLNPFSMRPGANRESDLEWLGLSATVRTDAKEFKLRPLDMEKPDDFAIPASPVSLV